MKRPTCNGTPNRHGKTGAGHQRYLYKACRKAFTDSPEPSPIHPIRIPFDREVMVLSLLVEGMSIRADEAFMEKMDRTTTGRFQLPSTGGRDTRRRSPTISAPAPLRHAGEGVRPARGTGA